MYVKSLTKLEVLLLASYSSTSLIQWVLPVVALRVMLVVLEIEFSINSLLKWTVLAERRIFSSLVLQIDQIFLMRLLSDLVVLTN